MTKKELFNANYALPIYVLLIGAIIGISWLSFNKVEAATIFLTLFLASIGVLVLSFLFIDETDPKNIKNFFKVPFGTDLDLSVGLFVLGISVPLIVEFIGGVLGTGFSLTSIQVPLAAASTVASITQSFSAVQATASPFWNFFITTFVAGTVEELVFGFIAILAGFLVAKAISQLSSLKETSTSMKIVMLAFSVIFAFLLSGFFGFAGIVAGGFFVLLFIIELIAPSILGGKTFGIVFAILFSIVLFTSAHQLNQSYTTIGTFIFAAVFRLLLNVSIYFGPALLSFTVGMHLMNNTVYYASTFGKDAFFQAISSLPGMFIIVFFGLIMLYFFRRFGIIIRKMANSASDIF